mmetsp:Transcript_178811/g.573078  ORF Transcript_178811/g.573078 Transcript_178811/m.573078 type:complete len:227 (-) Transcript_178811:279-959(-)
MRAGGGTSGSSGWRKPARRTIPMLTSAGSSVPSYSLKSAVLCRMTMVPIFRTAAPVGARALLAVKIRTRQSSCSWSAWLAFVVPLAQSGSGGVVFRNARGRSEPTPHRCRWTQQVPKHRTHRCLEHRLLRCHRRQGTQTKRRGLHKYPVQQHSLQRRLLPRTCITPVHMCASVSQLSREFGRHSLFGRFGQFGAFALELACFASLARVRQSTSYTVGCFSGCIVDL